MENHITLEIIEQASPPETPSLIKYISSNELEDFDEFDSEFPSPISKESEETYNHQRKPSISVSMPLCYKETQLQSLNNNNNKNVSFSGENVIIRDDLASGIAMSEPPRQSKFKSQPMPKGVAFQQDGSQTRKANRNHNQPGIKMFRDKRFDSFKTWSGGGLERQLSILRGKEPIGNAQDGNNATRSFDRALPVDRYFDALEGPELETLKSSEEIMLPHDKQWPFLLRFPVSSFGICLGVSSQAILWKTLATSPTTEFLHITPKINLILWYISAVLIATIFAVYILKLLFYFEAVRREYYHPIRVNFFFAPWIALLFLALGVPPSVTKNLHQSLWYILMAPILFLELKIYGQWMSGGQRRLSKVANPSNHLSVVGNFVGALLGASMGLIEGPIFFFAVGLAHYTVLFVTLYQRLPTNATLPKELHPVFFLFVAAPSVASMAWAKIQGSFDYGSRIAYFIALFLYFSLAVRINFFRGFKFSLAWWAYTFPMTGAAIATIRYSNQVPNIVTKSLCIALALISTFTVIALLLSTILHAFVFRDLFPNDIAIAISDRKRKPHKHWLFRYGSQDSKEIENYLKFVNTDESSLDDSTPQPSSNDTDHNLPK
ncbi:putative voltage-dependent anion channel [Medicago truncatula]|uniref:Putative voltage-dependent anion channel n=1 Tax=Medicago truncatula TaxID=3880 RepID=A0A396HJ49_MEDTR|nr:S-type anion channel SLAH2 [Medicago truncatula]RHN50927.1 putative voltage-dependent anion channel [Medicago truncatula]